jgi:hypothetical protein
LLPGFLFYAILWTMKAATMAEEAKRVRGGTRPAALRRITLADVAKQAGVSRVAVCEVLNNRPNCWASEATRQRIRDAAEALEYRPNLAARALRMGRTQVIGLVSPGFFTYSPYSRADGLTEAAARDFRVRVQTTHGTCSGTSRGTLRLAEKLGKRRRNERAEKGKARMTSWDE